MVTAYIYLFFKLLVSDPGPVLHTVVNNVIQFPVDIKFDIYYIIGLICTLLYAATRTRMPRGPPGRR